MGKHTNFLKTILIAMVCAMIVGAGIAKLPSDAFKKTYDNAQKSFQTNVSAPLLTQINKPSCLVKGNISIETQERIYHVPGQEYYEETRIRPEYGERWFCTEAEALSAGWRKSKI